MSNNPRKSRKTKIPNDVVRFVDHSMDTAKQINIILKKLNKNQADLANLLGKRESEISKWMRGAHNFTYKTISKIESVLNESLIVCPKDVVANYFWVFSNSPFVTIKIKEPATIESSQIVSGNLLTSSNKESEVLLYENSN